MMYQIRFFSFSVLLSLLLLTYAFDYHGDRAAVERIKRYTKRQVDGTCMYNMCNETEGYPAEEIEQLIQNKAEYRDLFGTVVAPYKSKDISIENRLADLDESNMCGTESIFMLPQRALDAEGIWQTIVNIGGEFKQMVHFEACSSEAHCIAEGYIPGQKVYCSQTEILLKMLVFDVNQLESAKIPLKMASFRIPSGCACVYKTD